MGRSGFMAVLCAMALGWSIPAYPHGGGLDASGCHHNRKTGDYHCHRAPSKSVPPATQSSSSKNQPANVSVRCLIKDRQLTADNSADCIAVGGKPH